MKRKYRVKSPERADQIKLPEPIGMVLLDQKNEAIVPIDHELADELIIDGYPITEIRKPGSKKKKKEK